MYNLFQVTNETSNTNDAILVSLLLNFNKFHTLTLIFPCISLVEFEQANAYDGALCNIENSPLIDLHYKSMDWLLYNMHFCHE